MRKEILMKTCVFIAAVTSVSLLYHNNILLTMILLAVLIVATRGKVRKYDILFFLGGTVVCAFGEIICVLSGAWTYTNPSFWEIPLWLPVAWGTVSLSIKRTAERLILQQQKSE